MRNVLRAIFALSALIALAGCSHTEPALSASIIQPTSQPTLTDGLQPPQPVENVQTLSPIPIGWQPDPAKHSGEHDHQAWLSPSRHTAYGVITFNNWLLPFASDQTVLDKFLETMKKSEGEANLLARKDDTKFDGLRFIAEGGLYTIRGNLVTKGTRGWVIYAGTLRREPVNDEELHLAERAREQTVVGVDRRADAHP